MSSGGFWRSPSIVTTIAPAGPGEPRVHRRVLAEVPLEPHGPDAPVGRVEALEHRERPVGRAVVDVR